MNTIHTDSIDQGVLHQDIERVYRYHLARRGSEREAEALTRATFQSFYRHYDDMAPAIPAPGPLYTVALFRAALSQQARLRHGGIDTGLVEGDPNQAQEMIYLRARVAALADTWASLPPIQGDLLALACFAGLDLPETSQVIRRDPAQVQAMLSAHGIDIRDNLAELASQITPRQDFSASLEVELSQLPRGRKRGPLHWARTIDWRGVLGGSGAQRTVKMAGGLVTAGLLIYGLWATFSPGLPRASPTPAPTQAVADTGAGAVNPLVGYLAPPDQATCLRWQSALTDLIRAPGPLAMIDNAPVNDPTTSGPDSIGFGCTVDLNPDGQVFRVNMNRVTTLLNEQGFTQDNAGAGDCPTPPSSSSISNFTRGCGFARGGSWVNLKANPPQRVILEFSGVRPYGGPLASGGSRFSLTPPSSVGTIPSLPDEKPNACVRNPTDGPCVPPVTPTQRRGVMLRITITSTTLKPTIDNFIYQWAVGNPNVMASLSPELRKGLPDLSTLDARAGIQRRPDLNVKVTWLLLGNTGHQVRLQVRVDQASGLALPDLHSGPFQVAFTWVDGQWKVSSVS
jgi:DNA-directed RNA polymerase specialized sigma24 family protein